MGEVLKMSDEVAFHVVRPLAATDIALLPKAESGDETAPLEKYKRRLATEFGPKGGLLRKRPTDAAKAQHSEVEALNRQRNPSGIPPSFDNAIRALQQLGVEPRYNVFRRRFLIGDHSEPLGQTLKDIVRALRKVTIDRMRGFDPGSDHLTDAVLYLAKQNSFDPVRDYLDGLKWDGEQRLDGWLTRYLGAEDDELTRAMGRAVLIAGVRRVRRPGCKFDFVLVLEGPQGTGKSTALQILAGSDEYFTDVPMVHLEGKQQQELLRGRWIVEMAELAGMRKAEAESVKAFVSRRYDSARGPWELDVEDAARRCIIIGTTNDNAYLQDATGNRRFWPVATGKIDLDGLARDRDQIWAEAAAAEVDEGDPITIPRDLWDAASQRQSARLQDDPLEDILVDLLPRHAKLTEGEWRVKSSVLITQVLDTRFMRDSKRLAACMRKLGWQGPKPIRIEGQVVKGYTRPQGTGERPSAPLNLRDRLGGGYGSV